MSSALGEAYDEAPDSTNSANASQKLRALDPEEAVAQASDGNSGGTTPAVAKIWQQDTEIARLRQQLKEAEIHRLRAELARLQLSAAPIAATTTASQASPAPMVIEASAAAETEGAAKLSAPRPATTGMPAMAGMSAQALAAAEMRQWQVLPRPGRKRSLDSRFRGAGK